MRRSRLEIKVDILEAIADGIHKKTKIMYATNTCWKLLTELMNEMIEQGKIIKDKLSYSVSPEGYDALLAGLKLEELLEEAPQK